MTGFNLILCYYALGDKEKMQQGFVRMLSIQQVRWPGPRSYEFQNKVKRRAIALAD